MTALRAVVRTVLVPADGPTLPEQMTDSRVLCYFVRPPNLMAGGWNHYTIENAGDHLAESGDTFVLAALVAGTLPSGTPLRVESIWNPKTFEWGPWKREWSEEMEWK